MHHDELTKQVCAIVKMQGCFRRISGKVYIAVIIDKVTYSVTNKNVTMF